MALHSAVLVSVTGSRGLTAGQLVTPDQLQALVDALGRVDHGSDWDGPWRLADGTSYVWLGKPHYEEKYRNMLKKALPILGFEV